MKKNETMIVKGYSAYSNTRKPVKKDAKYHANEYCIQLVVNDDDLPDKLKKVPQLKDFDYSIIPDDVEFPVVENPKVLVMYSKYPISMFDMFGNKRTSDELANLDFGQEIKVAVNIYENKQGKQAGVVGIEVVDFKEQETFNPFAQ